jgi:hypothetical protein
VKNAPQAASKHPISWKGYVRVGKIVLQDKIAGAVSDTEDAILKDGGVELLERTHVGQGEHSRDVSTFFCRQLTKFPGSHPLVHFVTVRSVDTGKGHVDQEKVFKSEAIHFFRVRFV